MQSGTQQNKTSNEHIRQNKLDCIPNQFKNELERRQITAHNRTEKPTSLNDNN